MACHYLEQTPTQNGTAMRPPWIELLFLHGHATPAKLAWRCDKPDCDKSSRQIEVDVARLPLNDFAARERSCHA
jgi:hypothetical protein